ncbi:hypothetical protein [Bacteroides thetaiotaomicron]|uniref:hypothetical protein n=1 Tax=Bacteroides thetaiotaomicron TaxID=818 RepID=UPI0022068374|nr:hypothetical protein [Bacteroides thetaiotaomicron]UVV52464.1 hypothetical protein NXY15_22760 [Bacteroides thetaiotaomicron]
MLNNAKAFRKIGHEVKFINWGGKYQQEDLYEDGMYQVDGLEYVITHELDATGGFFNKLKAKIHRDQKTLTLLEQITEKPDLIIMYNADYSCTRKMQKFCNQYRIKLANDITE